MPPVATGRSSAETVRAQARAPEIAGGRISAATDLRALAAARNGPDRAGVEAGDLEQVLDQLLEAGDVGDHEVDGGLGGGIGHVVASRGEDLDGGREGHEG